MNLEIDKIKNIALYFAGNIPDLYFTKFLKLVYYLDFISVLERGEPVTRDIYYHLPYGPVPSFIKDHLSLLKSEIKSQEESIVEDSGSNQIESVFSGIIELSKKSDGFILEKKKEPEISYLSEYERGLLDDIIKDLGGKRAKELVEKTHAEPPYMHTIAGNVIDYKLAFYLDRSMILPNRTSPLNIEISQAEFFNR